MESRAFVPYNMTSSAAGVFGRFSVDRMVSTDSNSSKTTLPPPRSQRDLAKKEWFLLVLS